MPKRSNKPFRRFVRKTVGRVFNAADKITKTVGSMFCAVELAASTVTTVPMKPNNAFFGGRVQSFADCFNEFRFSSFRLTIYPQGHDVMIAYDSIPNSTSTSPAYADLVNSQPMFSIPPLASQTPILDWIVVLFAPIWA